MKHRNYWAQAIYSRQRGDIRGYDRSMRAGLTPLSSSFPMAPQQATNTDQLLLVAALTAAGIFLLTR